MLAAAAGRADAEYTGLVRLTTTTATNSDPKTLVATCPAGTRVISAGGDTTGDGTNGRVVLDIVRPDPTLTEVTLHAREDETGTSGTWFLQAFVICAAAPPRLALVKATSAVSSANKSVAATCPSGDRLIGGSGETTGASGQVLLTGLQPNAGHTALTATASEDSTGTTGTWSVTAYAICAARPTGFAVVSATSASSSTANKVATATCPAGLSVIGTLGKITSSAGHVVRDGIFSNAELTTASISAFEDVAGTTANWTVTAYAMCAPSATLVSFTSTRQAAFSVALGGGCPAGRLAFGLGADLTGGYGRVSVSGMLPAGANFQTTAITHDDSGADSWALTGQGICSPPMANLQFVTSTSPTDSTQQKIEHANCASGQRLLGVSGSVSGGHVLLTAARPDSSSLTSATAIGIEDQVGTDGDWSVTLSLVCATAPPGLQLVTASTPLGLNDFAQATATCPAGKHVIGTGHSIFFEQVMLDQVGIDPTLSKVTLTAFEDHDGATVPWEADVHAMCINR